MIVIINEPLSGLLSPFVCLLTDHLYYSSQGVTTVRCRTRLRVTTQPGLLFHFIFLVSPQSRLLLRPVHPAPARRGYSGLFPMPSIIYAYLVLSLSRTVSHFPMTGLLRQLLVSDRTRPSCT